jgi:hypothetical protein
MGSNPWLQDKVPVPPPQKREQKNRPRAICLNKKNIGELSGIEQEFARKMWKNMKSNCNLPKKQHKALQGPPRPTIREF